MTALLALLALIGLMQAAHSFGGAAALVGGPELTFGYLLLVAYFTGELVARVSLPRLTGYIIAGVFSGPWALGVVSHDLAASLSLVKGVAVCMIALTAGAELNLKRIRPLIGVVGSMVLWAVLGAVVAIAAAVLALRPLLPFLDELDLVAAIAVAVMLGVTLAAQSPAVVMALVSELHTDGVLTRLVLAMVIVSDLVVVVLYALSSALVSAVVGGDVDIGSTLASVSWELFGSAGIGVFVGMLLGLFIRKVDDGHALFATMLCFLVAEVAHPLHLDTLIVMLAAGIYLENVSRCDAHRLIESFESASLPVYLVFFALAGATLDVERVVDLIIPVSVICVVRAWVFWAGCRIAARRTRAEPAVRRFAWTGLVPQAGLALALAVIIGRAFPSFGPGAEALIIGVVAINQLIPPVILRLAFLRSGEAGKRVAHEVGEHD